MEKSQFYEKLSNYVISLPQDFNQISIERKQDLESIGDYIIKKIEKKREVPVIVICTHNSRRSHMGQIWMQIAATYYKISNITTYSGGTEGTTFNPRAVAAMKRAGFKIIQSQETIGESDENFKYLVSFNENGQEFQLFSKKYDHELNPQRDFAAVMVCSQADEACPIVAGADVRFVIPYEDPKDFDNTDVEVEKYDERCRQIAREMFYLMSYAKNKKSLER